MEAESGLLSIALAVGAAAVAFLVAYLIAPLTGRIARRLDIVDRPHDPGVGYKTHAEETPYLGGLAISGGILVGITMLVFVPGASIEGLLRLVLLGGLATFVLAVIGLLDDVRPIHPLIRFSGHLLAAGGAWALGFRVMLLPWPAVNFVITVIWIVGITNAFNLLDNMDGLSSGVAGVAGLSFAVMGVLAGSPALAIAAACIAGACWGFLRHNRHPAKIFMGDSGSLLLGFLLALIGVRLHFENLLQVTFLVPVIVLGIPIFDTTLVVLSRLKNGHPLLEGARDHVSHRLVAIGLPVPEAVRLLYWSGLCLGWVGLAITRANVQVGWMLLVLVLALGAFLGRLLWKVPVYAVISPPDAPR